MPAGSTLSTLTENLLVAVDAYNAADLGTSTVGSAGYRAREALNKALSRIYSMAKDTEVVQKDAESTALASTANQDHILLSAISDIDDIVSLYDAAQDYNLKRVSFKEYRRLFPDPSASTGTPEVYTRWGDRILLGPRPSSIITYTVFYTKIITKLTNGGDQTGIDAKFDYWILDEAAVEWFRSLDGADQATISTWEKAAADSRELAMRDLYAEYDLEDETQSHWDEIQGPTRPRFTSPAG